MAATVKLEKATALDLFTPIELGPYQLRNRIVMAPLTRSCAGDGNVPHALNALYYAQRASAGLIIAEFNHVASSLSNKGLAYLHVIEGDTMGQRVGPFDYAEIRRRFDGLYMANNGFDKARANRAIAEGKADLIAFGKPFIANPDLVTRFLLDAPLSELNRDTLYGGAKQGYTDYPALDAVAATPLAPLPCWG